MTKNVYFHDNVMFILKTSPGLAVSVLVYSFSLRSVVWRTVSAVSQRLTGTCPTVFTGIYLTYVIRGLDSDKTIRDYAHFQMFKIIYRKALYRSKSVVKSGSILKPRYSRFRVISDRAFSGLQCTLIGKNV